MSTGRNEEIVKKFLASKAFDFVAFGKFVAENGADLASSEDGEFGFVIGNRFIRYCIPPVTDLFDGVDGESLREEVTGL
jgi:hypothetical protein